MFKYLLGAVMALFTALAFAAVDVNKADAAALDTVKGIGPGIAGKILDERKKGAFKDWTDLVNRVQGIGETNAAKLSEAGLTVNGQTFKGVAAAPAKKDEPKKDEKAAPAKAAAPAPATAPAAAAGDKKADDKKADAKADAKKDAKPDAKADKAAEKKAAEEKAKAEKAEKKAAADKEKAEKKAAAEKAKAEKEAAKKDAAKKDDKPAAKAADKAASAPKK